MNAPTSLTLQLASASPRRRILLDTMNLRYEVRPAQVEEFEDPDAVPQSLVFHNARIKAEYIARQYPAHPVLAADTTVSINGYILNKPVDMQEAWEMLSTLSGNTHTVYTGICMIFSDKGIEEIECVASNVTFRKLDDNTISRYFELVNPLDKAGAYGIQEGKELIIESFEGSFTNIMGLPVEKVTEMLEAHDLIETLKR